METAELKVIADYANVSIFEVEDLDYIRYLELLRDAVIYNNMQSKEGRERLDEAWILEQTKPDRKRLREHFK